MKFGRKVQNGRSQATFDGPISEDDLMAEKFQTKADLVLEFERAIFFENRVV